MRCIKNQSFDEEKGCYHCEPHSDRDCPLVITANGLSEGGRKSLMNVANAASIIENLHRKLWRDCKELYSTIKPILIETTGPGKNMTVEPGLPTEATYRLLEDAKENGFRTERGVIPFSDIIEHMRLQLMSYGEAWENLTMTEREYTVYRLTCHMVHIEMAIDIFNIDIYDDYNLFNAVEWSIHMYEIEECMASKNYPLIIARSWLAQVYLNFGRDGYVIGTS